MRSLMLISVLFFYLQAAAGTGEGGYAVSKIPVELLKNANAVLRSEAVEFEIRSTRETIKRNHYVITILRESGDHWSEFSEYYDQHTRVGDVVGILYDAFGNQVKKIRKKDLEDVSGVANSNLIDDNRLKRHNFYHRSYPYTIEYSVETVTAGSLFFPMWVPQGREGLAVERSSMKIISPIDYEVRHKAFNFSGKPVIAEENKKRISLWTAENMPAIIREPFSPAWHELTTFVLYGPTSFELSGYQGNMASWQDFGKFVHALKADRDVLPDNIKQKVKELVQGTDDTVEKIRRIYSYLQKNTRYISIQLGIGGWQPFAASDVATKGYGDCKALTNYMYSMLKEAGIASFYSLVRAGRGENQITADFPSQQFNHVILCVPLKADTMWLECTSQTLAAGYLSQFTSDRHALLIDVDGGKLVRTPKYGLNDNLQIRHVKGVLDEKGNLELQASTRYGAVQQDDIHTQIRNLSRDDMKKKLDEKLSLGTYQVEQFSYEEGLDPLPFVDESLRISVNHYATITGKRLFIVPNVLTRSYRKLEPDSTRKYDLQLGVEYRDVDSVEITVPAGYMPESVPEPISINTQFGTYRSSVTLDDNRLIYYRSIEQYAGRFPASEYKAMAAFYESIYRADRKRVVLVSAPVTWP